MTDGIALLGRPALSAMTVEAIEHRLLRGLATEAIIARAGAALVRPNLLKFVPYAGWAFTIGTTLYAAYEAYNEVQVDWAKMESEVYDSGDLAVFLRGFTEVRRSFVVSDAGRIARDNQWKYILIPSEIMPMIAQVDAVGMEIYGDILQWDPDGAGSRRSSAMRGRSGAGDIKLLDGTSVRGSWEEYPFAVTQVPGRTGAHVDRVPLRENWIQGGFIRAAAMAQGFQRGMTIRCFIV
ncbi:hypothetical protein GXW71_18225 [Roseomonas hellenica]|uniref:Deoxyribonuclease NucA/NucB domain-containing protein n=1 Tax=Plastoroseomonas hellenica TaxID=2687306 RepID=A0ABS5F179_9PROT|nr:hypothetical protein [Plastoroseomonas hellenica]MBR0666304.1 hypothetical protein [Plastoroseomonas hellenica]